MRKGFLVVSGCPRSGTSVNMDIQRAAHGEEAICGSKFPQENRKRVAEEETQRQAGESFHTWQVRKYLSEKRMEEENLNTPEAIRDFHDLNPEGFYEMAFTVQGIIYRPFFKKLLEGVRNGDMRVVKVVSQGLMASDPNYISKIIYTIRHPRAVAKSQERLVRGFTYHGDDGRVHNAFDNMVVHTPEMFIKVTVDASRFFLMNPEIPVRFYHFENLVRDPLTILEDMQEFVGCGDYSNAKDIVQPKLNRSQHEDVENELWSDADFIYDHFCRAAEIINDGGNREEAEVEWRKIIGYIMDPKRNFNRQNRTWKCFRAKHNVVEAMCRECIKGGSATYNFRKHSESIEGSVAKHWSEEPCLFECGMDLDREEYVTIEDSIKNNFWSDLTDPQG